MATECVASKVRQGTTECQLVERFEWELWHALGLSENEMDTSSISDQH